MEDSEKTLRGTLRNEIDGAFLPHPLLSPILPNKVCFWLEKVCFCDGRYPRYVFGDYVLPNIGENIKYFYLWILL